MAGIVITVPMATFVGEVLAYASEGLRRQQDEERRRSEVFERLSAAVAQMRAGTTSERAANMLADLACQSFACDDVLVVVRRSDGGTATAIRGNSHLVVEAAPPDVMNSAETDSTVRDAAVNPGEAAGETLLTVPLMGPTGILGVVRAVLAVPPDVFRMDTARRYQGVASHALVQRATVEASAEDARRDALTGLGNRRMAQDLISGLRAGDALVIIDLDHFKSINDTEGHSAGDEVLRQLGRFLREEVRGSDAVARYGGEEFIIVARDVKGAALPAAERLVERWRDTGPRTTFSAGVATRTDGETPQQVLDRADEALYRAKELGRNQAQEAF
jgi:diguanylate cyclase (GGDEF)-like protein